MNKRGEIGAVMFLLFGALLATVFILLMINKINQLTNFEELAANYHADEIKNTIEAIETQEGYFNSGYYIGKISGVSVGFIDGPDKSAGMNLKKIYVQVPTAKNQGTAKGQMITRTLLISPSDVLSPVSQQDPPLSDAKKINSQNILIQYSNTGGAADITLTKDNVCTNDPGSSAEKFTAADIRGLSDAYVRDDVPDSALNDPQRTIMIITTDKSAYCGLYYKIKNNFRARVEMAQVPSNVLSSYTQKKVMIVVS